MKCKECGIKNYNIKELFDKFKNSKYNYLNSKCACGKIKGKENNKYEFCTLCKKRSCSYFLWQGIHTQKVEPFPSPSELMPILP